MSQEVTERRANPRVPAVFDLQGESAEGGIVARMQASDLSLGGLRVQMKKAPEGTIARPSSPDSRITSTSTVGFPRLSSISRAITSVIIGNMSNFLPVLTLSTFVIGFYRRFLHN